MTLEITVEDGKYTFICRDGEITYLRYGEPWGSEADDDRVPPKAFLSLLFEFDELKKDHEVALSAIDKAFLAWHEDANADIGKALASFQLRDHLSDEQLETLVKKKRENKGTTPEWCDKMYEQIVAGFEDDPKTEVIEDADNSSSD